MSSSVFYFVALTVFLGIVVSRTEAKCQIVCHEWADSNFKQCNNAEVKCANNLPDGYYCLKFSDGRPPVCLEMIPEGEVRSSPRPRRYKPVIDYSVEKAPNVQLLP